MCFPGNCGLKKTEKGPTGGEMGKEPLVLLQKISVSYISFLLLNKKLPQMERFKIASIVSVGLDSEYRLAGSAAKSLTGWWQGISQGGSLI